MGDRLEQVDEEIALVRQQIQDLTTRRRMISSSLLGSTKVQKALKQRASSDELPNDDLPIVSASQAHAQSNIHRLTFSTTAFPFDDPSPTAPARLLGVRIDICRRSGKFDKPYYLMLKKDDGKHLRVYRHTIPVFIPLKELEEQYLPLPQDGAMDEPPQQNLHMLVRKLRHELVSWTARCDAVEALQEQLGVSAASNTGQSPSNAITSVVSAATDARYVRIVWRDGRVGRIRLSNKGLVEKAVVFGRGATRDISTEKLLAAGRHTIRGLSQVLKSM